MKNWHSTIVGAFCLFLFFPALHGQAAPAGYYRSHAQAGAGVLYLNNDYTVSKNGGVSAWVDYDFTHLFGIEAALHFGGIIASGDIGENSYLIGPRVMYHRRKLTVYGKLLVGRGTITDQLFNKSSTYNILPAYGGGVEYRLTRRLNLRAADIELQKWPDFYPNTLSPIALSVGLMYTIR